MFYQIKIHYDNYLNFQEPHIWIWYMGSAKADGFLPTGNDALGFVYDIPICRPEFNFKFKDGPGTASIWEDRSLNHHYHPLAQNGSTMVPNEIWCKGDRASVYGAEPIAPESVPSGQFLRQLTFKQGTMSPEAEVFPARSRCPIF